jgi:hypothetical protein
MSYVVDWLALKVIAKPNFQDVKEIEIFNGVME